MLSGKSGIKEVNKGATMAVASPGSGSAITQGLKGTASDHEVGSLSWGKRSLEAQAGLPSAAPNPSQCLQPHKAGVLTPTLQLQTLSLVVTYSIT